MPVPTPNAGREQALDLTELVQSMREAGDLDKGLPLIAVCKQVAGQEKGKVFTGMVDVGRRADIQAEPVPLPQAAI